MGEGNRAVQSATAILFFFSADQLECIRVAPLQQAGYRHKEHKQKMRTHQLPSPTPTLTTSGATRQQDRFNHRNMPLAMASTCHPAAPARMIQRPRAMFEGPVPSQEGVPRGGASRMSRVKLTRVTPSCRFGLRRVLNLQRMRGEAQRRDVESWAPTAASAPLRAT
jgi:hypothetical protein